MRRQPRRLGGAVHARECRPASKCRFGCRAHLRARLHADDGVAVLEKRLRGEPRARADVGDSPQAVETDLLAQQRHQAARIAGPEAHVIGNAIGEATCRVAAHALPSFAIRLFHDSRSHPILCTSPRISER